MAIDLERRGLPRHLAVESPDGGTQLVAVRTDFRDWLRFGRLLEERGVCDPRVLAGFPDEVPDGPWQPAAMEFYSAPVACPHREGGPERPRALDVALDGDYVVAAFWQAYGVDLTACDMHWHLFRALLRGLPDSTKLAQAMGWRTWLEGDERRKPTTVRRELRDAWSLPRPDEAEMVAMQQALFGARSQGGDE